MYIYVKQRNSYNYVWFTNCKRVFEFEYMSMHIFGPRRLLIYTVMIIVGISSCQFKGWLILSLFRFVLVYFGVTHCLLGLEFWFEKVCKEKLKKKGKKKKSSSVHIIYQLILTNIPC